MTFPPKSIIGIAVALTVLSALSVASMYVWQFGGQLSTERDIWAQFGDYFGGVLNPIFAMVGFLGLLWSILVQAREFRSSAQLLQRQTKSAEEQLEILRNDRVRDDLLHVIKDIDTRIDGILEASVSDAQSLTETTIKQMLSEAQRLRRQGGTSAAYAQFLTMAQRSGTVVEAYTRELQFLVSRLRDFLQTYSSITKASFSPTLIYYADKAYQLMDLLEDIGDLPDDTRAFFSTISDHHH